MVKKWDKYKNSDRVSNSSHTEHMENSEQIYNDFIAGDNCWQTCKTAAGFSDVSEFCNTDWITASVSVESRTYSAQMYSLIKNSESKLLTRI